MNFGRRARTFSVLCGLKAQWDCKHFGIMKGYVESTLAILQVIKNDILQYVNCTLQVHIYKSKLVQLKINVNLGNSVDFLRSYDTC